MPLLINHVMSVSTHSSIFDDFIERIKSGASSHIQHLVSIEPMPNADIYHYHRPQKCQRELIKDNSICTLHFDPFDLRQHSSIYELNKVLSSFKRVVFLNKNTFNTCDFLEDKRVLIPHGYDDLLTLRGHKKPHTTFNIAFICRYYKDGRKGEAYLFELFNSLPENTLLFLIGRDWPIGIEKKCKRIKTIHPRSYQDIIRLYSIIDMVMIASPYEGGPACLPEALAAGCIVYSSRCGMAEDILDEKFLLDYDLKSDQKKILNTIDYFKKTRNPDNISRLITWDAVSQEYNNLYQSMV